MEQLQEKCGIFGIRCDGSEASRLTFSALCNLQHRGQEGSGITSSDYNRIYFHKGLGLVRDVFRKDSVIKKLAGSMAIGHCRYATSGGGGLRHVQPILINDDFAFGHNGNLPSIKSLHKFLRGKGVNVKGFSDSKLMVHAIHWYMENGCSAEDAIVAAYPLFTGAFSAVAMTKTSLFAFRDKCGIRPLVMGKLNGGFVFASETCAFDLIDATFIRDVKPGELVIVDDSGVRSIQVMPSEPAFDLFEEVYFMRPDSLLDGRSVLSMRYKSGTILAKEHPVKVDLVVPVLETGSYAASAYGWKLRIKVIEALVKNRDAKRTFIEPDQRTRELGVLMKHSPVPDIVKGKRIALMDDSIVRGTTSKHLVQAMRDAGATEVHVLVCSPPVRYPDFYGINTPKREELIAAYRSVGEVCQYIGANSLHYLSLEGLIKSTGMPASRFSTSCFTGEYPISLEERALELD